MKLGEFSGHTTHFISDLHLGHNNIIKYSERPFADVEEMNTALVSNWNAVMEEGTDVFLLGDFAFASEFQIEMFLCSLRGVKHLVTGNHDGRLLKKERLRSHFRTISDIAEIAVNGRPTVLCHYPIESWPGGNRGALHLHGHSHGKSRLRKNRLDVGVDANKLYRPISWDEVLEFVQERNMLAMEQPLAEIAV